MPKAAEIKDRKSVADQVCEWMHNHCRDMSIDTLLTWPDHATAMAKAVCRRMHRKPTSDAIHEICRAALSSRKRGDLKRDRY